MIDPTMNNTSSHSFFLLTNHRRKNEHIGSTNLECATYPKEQLP